MEMGRITPEKREEGGMSMLEVKGGEVCIQMEGYQVRSGGVGGAGAQVGMVGGMTLGAREEQQQVSIQRGYLLQMALVVLVMQQQQEVAVGMVTAEATEEGWSMKALVGGSSSREAWEGGHLGRGMKRRMTWRVGGDRGVGGIGCRGKKWNPQHIGSSSSMEGVLQGLEEGAGVLQVTISSSSSSNGVHLVEGV